MFPEFQSIISWLHCLRIVMMEYIIVAYSGTKPLTSMANKWSSESREVPQFSSKMWFHLIKLLQPFYNTTYGTKPLGSLPDLNCSNYRLVQPIWKIVWKFLKKVKVELSCDLEISLLERYTKVMKSLPCKDIRIYFLNCLSCFQKKWHAMWLN